MIFFGRILCCFLITGVLSSTPRTERECPCKSLGVDQKLDPCKSFTGQCPCLPHVTGKLCDKCENEHYGYGNPSGCFSCDCDPAGSISMDCNGIDGQCDCKSGYLGRNCETLRLTSRKKAEH